MSHMNYYIDLILGKAFFFFFFFQFPDPRLSVLKGFHLYFLKKYSTFQDGVETCMWQDLSDYFYFQ